MLSFCCRVAEFVEGNSWHVNNEELLEYDTGPDPMPPHLISDEEEEEEEEMDFILSSPWTDLEHKLRVLMDCGLSSVVQNLCYLY